jgi:DNA-binding MarR family transcriptional regulator
VLRARITVVRRRIAAHILKVSVLVNAPRPRKTIDSLVEPLVARDDVARGRKLRHYDKFLAGPVPWYWLRAASQLGGKALHVGLALWQRKGVTKNWTVRVSLRALDLGFDPSNGSRGLAGLERAGLVRIQRSPGRALLVTIIDEGDVTQGGAKSTPDADRPSLSLPNDEILNQGERE